MNLPCFRHIGSLALARQPVACVAGARRGKGRGKRAKSERGARRGRGGGGGQGVVPAASLLFSPLHPLINIQMQDICKTSGCQITSNENLADFSREGLERMNCVLVFLAC